MIDKIITNHSKLKTISKETTIEEVESLDLINRLRASNGTAWTKGAGLAAIQIGIALRFAWFIWGEKEFTLLNPCIIEFGGKRKLVREGCLSIPNKYFKVKRRYKIKYTSDGKRLSARGFKAELIQHEIDHMNGVLISDKKE